jgi:hypothetical protein
MTKHKLIKLRKIIDERIRSLTEEVEIATNMKLNPPYTIADRKDEIEFVESLIVALLLIQHELINQLKSMIQSTNEQYND